MQRRRGFWGALARLSQRSYVESLPLPNRQGWSTLELGRTAPLLVEHGPLEGLVPRELLTGGFQHVSHTQHERHRLFAEPRATVLKHHQRFHRPNQSEMGDLGASVGIGQVELGQLSVVCVVSTDVNQRPIDLGGDLRVIPLERFEGIFHRGCLVAQRLAFELGSQRRAVLSQEIVGVLRKLEGREVQ